MIEINLIDRYVKGIATPEEKGKILSWLEESDENKRYFAELMSNFTLHSTIADAGFENRREDMVDRLNARIDTAEENTRRRRRTMRPVWTWGLAFAAAAVVVLFAFIPGTSHRSQHAEPATETLYSYANNTSGIKSVLLADRTKLFLKPGSEIEYNVTGLADRRLVRITGEGYFDVAKDSLRPLYVEMSGLSLKVLGTAFTVRSIPDCDVEVVLERGSVRLMNPDGTALVRMEPDQKAVFRPGDGDLRIDQVKSLPYVIEQFNLESLENVSAEQIARHLEHVYGVRINTRIADPERRYYFNFLRTDSVEEALDVVRHLTGEQFTIKY